MKYVIYNDEGTRRKLLMDCDDVGGQPVWTEMWHGARVFDSFSVACWYRDEVAKVYLNTITLSIGYSYGSAQAHVLDMAKM